MVSTNPAVALSMTAGLPFYRQIRATNIAAIWPTVDDFEIRSQIRAGRSVLTPLLGDLRPYLKPRVDGSDIIVDLALTGHDTRLLPAGFYDIIISDPGETDARAFSLIHGKIKLTQLVTEGSDD